MATALDPDQEPLISSPDEDPVSSSSNTVDPAFTPSAPPADSAEAAAASSTGATPKRDRSKEKTSPLEENNEEDDKDQRGAAFECNICLDVATDAVISMCGHLFCWPCLHTWLETRPQRQICPVCKAGIGKDKVVPVYGRGDSNPKDPRDKPLPPRPRGQRPEPDSTGGGGAFGGFGGGGGAQGFQMSFGIGAFPFGFFATNFVNLGDGRGGQGPPEGSAQYEEEQFLHKAFLWVAFAFIFWLLIA